MNIDIDFTNLAQQAFRKATAHAAHRLATKSDLYEQSARRMLLDLPPTIDDQVVHDLAQAQISTYVRMAKANHRNYDFQIHRTLIELRNAALIRLKKAEENTPANLPRRPTYSELLQA